MKTTVALLIRKSPRFRALVFKVARLQSALGFSVLNHRNEVNTRSIEPKELADRVTSISKHIQLRKVVGFDLIRVGGISDGGYVMVDNFNLIEGVLSLGVGPDVSWDLALSKNVPLIHFYDHTVESLPAIVPNSKWFKEKIVAHSNTSGITLEQAINRLPNSNQLILKCDIEDDEWEILAEFSSEILEKFDQIVIEFHWIINKIFNHKFELMISVLEKLANSHSVVNIHANNSSELVIVANCPVPEVLEVTYVRTKSYNFQPAESHNKLNAPNDLRRPEISLNFPISL
jgi:hypothetical protein